MGAFDYGHITAINNKEARTVRAGATSGAALLSGEIFPVGMIGTTQDGRWYAYSQNGAAATVPGSIYTGPVSVAAYVNQSALATPVGATTVTFTQGATAITQNYFKGGVLTVEVTPGAGYAYGIDAHAAVGSATSYAWPLAPGESIQAALTATTSKLSLVSNRWRNLVIAPTTTLAALVAGVSQSTIAINGFGWLQVRGLASVLTDGTVVLGNVVATPSTNTAGACVALSQTIGTTVIEVPIGTVARVGATTAFSTVYLSIL